MPFLLTKNVKAMKAMQSCQLKMKIKKLAKSTI